ncbi:MAG: lectin like domain-containing protein [Acutalibacteraceae bacterium]
MKRVFTTILVAMIIATSLTACRTENASQTNQPTESTTEVTTETATEAKTEVSTEIKSEKPNNLPTSIDLRNYKGKNYVTPTKTQLFGDCWTFATISAVESAYLLTNDLGVPAGEVNDNVDFSEKYIAWYAYQSITKDDVTTGKIRSSQIGEGYDLSEMISEDSNIVYSLGGSTGGARLFSSGFSPVEEKVSVNSEYPYAYCGRYCQVIDGERQISPDDDWSIPLTSQYRNPESKAIFRSSYLLPAPSLTDENGEYKFNQEGVTAIKTELANGHGVFCCIFYGDNINYEHWAAYNNYESEANHAVAIIGYDDNFPKENFAQVDISSKIYENSIPPANGAFIVKDSTGELGIDDSGCYYISYYDHAITDAISFAFDKTDSAVCKNPNYDQYDMLMGTTYKNLDYDSKTKMANVFDTQENESLYQIGYTTATPNTTVHYEIYKDIKDDNPESGTLLEKGDTTHQWSGLHRIDLKDKHKLQKGEKYSVVLTMEYIDENGKSKYTEIFSCGANIPFIEAKMVAPINGIINKGESYIFTGGKWNDMTDRKDTLLKQAYNEIVKDPLVPETFKPHSIDDVDIDNYPIKAILIPEK